MSRALACLVFLLVCLVPHAAWSGALRLEVPGEVGHGEPFAVRAVSAERMEAVRFFWLDKDVPAEADRKGGGWSAFALLGTDVKCSEPGDKTLAVEALVDGRRVRAEAAVAVRGKHYPEQRLTVKKSMVTPPEETLARIRSESRQVKKALNTISPTRMWRLPLVRPVDGSVSSVYGLRRFFNDQPRSPHRGLDLRGARGTPVKAAASGKVILAGDHYFAGRSVYLDHGQGVVSMYFHLSQIGVREGQLVSAGEPVGEIGSSGRVTGPHLHFGLSLAGQSVDPSSLFKKDFAALASEEES
ncbi:M23 family metallopeptidase [Desulfohalovibrio reitneri]|uniref:M23 family metallopeptidase n=1 Tax=Desulfohalovibrio reitneri TaxID=1307759 RepID=UPI000690F715|nr:M23 family metallopeptidase [Desulfohalovibrio reitneri]